MERFPELPSALNFRDMGGYLAADGRRTRWKTLYRSGTTHAMTAADLQALEGLGVRYAFDLRSTPERLGQPSAFSAMAGVQYQYIDHDSLPGDLKRLMAKPDSTALHSRSMMIEAYQSIPREFSKAFRELFARLESGSLPLIFNCSAGKDRTGVAAALVLAALGVPRETIVEDYLLSNASFDRGCEILIEGNLATLFRADNRSLWEPLMGVDADYLLAAFEQIDQTFGSLEKYFADELYLSAPARERLRGALLF